MIEDKVVITGIGALAPNGNNVDEFWKNLKEFLLQKNSILLWIAIFLPSYGVYTMVPSKEAIFISFSLIYICFEAKNIVYKPIKKWNEFHLLLKRIIFLTIGLLQRGYSSFPYLILGFFVSLFPLISSEKYDILVIKSSLPLTIFCSFWLISLLTCLIFESLK